MHWYTLTPMKLAALNIIVAILLGYSIATLFWWGIIPCALSSIWGLITSNPKYWATLPRKEYEDTPISSVNERREAAGLPPYKGD